MNTEPVRMGYVGCGFLAQHTHLPNFSSLEGCRLVALAEVRSRLAQQVAARYGIPTVYASHRDLAADPAIEAVGVSAGFAQQGEIAADLLRAGKHVFMEKPMAVSVAQAERILNAARGRRAPHGRLHEALRPRQHARARLLPAGARVTRTARRSMRVTTVSAATGSRAWIRRG